MRRKRPFKVDDLIQWEANGCYQFVQPHRIRNIYSDPNLGTYVFVHGSDTGIPIDQITHWKDVK